MALTLWKSAVPGNFIDEFFNDLYTSPAKQEPSRLVPDSDVVDRGEKFELEIELPGVSKDGLKIEVKEHKLIVEGKKEYTKKVEEKDYHLRERDYGTYHRTFSLSQHIDSGNISAKFENGLLTLELPKKPESSPRKIEVK